MTPQKVQRGVFGGWDQRGDEAPWGVQRMPPYEWSDHQRAPDWAGIVHWPEHGEAPLGVRDSPGGKTCCPQTLQLGLQGAMRQYIAQLV